jgi:hypothetical protein
MRDLLRRRIEKLERYPVGNSLQDLPDDVLQRRLDLLLWMFVYATTGRDVAAPRRELEALGPLRLPERRSAPRDEAEMRELALGLPQSEPERADYRELLAMLAPDLSMPAHGSAGTSPAT